MLRLRYIDSYSLGNFHELFNATSLSMMSHVFDDITYYSTSSSMQAVKYILEGLPPNVKHLRLYNWNTRHLGTIVRTGMSAFWNCIILLLADKDDIIYYNFNSLWGLPFINWYCKFSRKKVIVQCHGELELLTNTKLKPYNYISMKILRGYLYNDSIHLAENLKFSVLGESILNNVEKEFPDVVSSHFISFEHTTIVNKERESRIKNKTETDILKIGIIGTIHPYADYNQKFEFAQKLKPYKKIDVYALGRIFFPKAVMDENNIKIIPNSENGFVSRDILLDYISEMDLICFIYPKNGYRYTASGSLLDAIACKKKIYSLHNDYFDGLSKRINYCCYFNSIDEMINSIVNRGYIANEFDYNENAEKASPKWEAVRFKKEITDSVFR